jgi:hypothetical protein
MPSPDQTQHEDSELTTEAALAVLLCDLRAASAGITKRDLWRFSWSTIACTPLFIVLVSPWISVPISIPISIPMALALACLELHVRLSNQRRKLIDQVIHTLAANQNDHRRRLERLELSKKN